MRSKRQTGVFLAKWMSFIIHFIAGSKEVSPLTCRFSPSSFACHLKKGYSETKKQCVVNLFFFASYSMLQYCILQSATRVNNTDHFITMQRSAGKV